VCVGGGGGGSCSSIVIVIVDCDDCGFFLMLEANHKALLPSTALHILKYYEFARPPTDVAIFRRHTQNKEDESNFQNQYYFRHHTFNIKKLNFSTKKLNQTKLN
jgi:hypothetical protein